MGCLVSDAKHTPGPWTLTHRGGSNFAVQAFEIRGMFGDSQNTYPIFNCDTHEVNGAEICVSPEDARLIAAAPEMKVLLAEVAEYGVPRFNARIRQLLARIDGEESTSQDGPHAA